MNPNHVRHMLPAYNYGQPPTSVSASSSNPTQTQQPQSTAGTATTTTTTTTTSSQPVYVQSRVSQAGFIQQQSFQPSSYFSHRGQQQPPPPAPQAHYQQLFASPPGHQAPRQTYFIQQNVSETILHATFFSDIQCRPDGLDSQNLKNKDDFAAFIECFADKDNYFCQICHNILWQPISCGNCSKIYCKECLSHWVETSSSCPTCRERFEPRKIEKSITNNLSKLIFACCQAGCEEFSNYDSLAKHQGACEFKEVPCNNTGCEFKAIRKDMFEHFQTCEHFLHSCQWCKRQIKRMNSAQHEEICEMKVLGCENKGCSEQLPRSEMSVHISECPYNIVRCDMCNSDFTLKEITMHKRICDFKIVDCIGCNVSMFKKHLTAHEETCDFVRLQCQHCTDVISRKDLPSHDEISCLKAGQRILLDGKTVLLVENACLKKDVETLRLCVAQLYEQVQELVAERSTQQFLRILKPCHPDKA